MGGAARARYRQDRREPRCGHRGAASRLSALARCRCCRPARAWPQGKVPFAKPAKPPPTRPNAALIFVDGLRMDVAQRLAGVLRAGCETVAVNWRWSGFPDRDRDLQAAREPGGRRVSRRRRRRVYARAIEGKPAPKPVLIKAIAAAGWPTRRPCSATEPMWLEAGRFDDDGHKLGADLATQSRTIC